MRIQITAHTTAAVWEAGMQGGSNEHGKLTAKATQL